MKSKNVDKTAIVIGAGIAGLATSALLAKDGYKVQVLEKNGTPGGRAMVMEMEGYTFDMGPSWYLMPDVFEHFFSLFNKKPSDYFELTRLDPSYRIFFEENKVFDVMADLDDNLKLFDSLELNGANKLSKYLEESKYKYEIAMKDFVYKSNDSIFDFVNKEMLLKGPKLDVFNNINSYVEKYFESDIARKILLYNIVFLGGTPKNTPALYSIMTHIDFNLGVWYPTGGIGSFINGLYNLAVSLGVEFNFDEPVTNVNVAQKNIASVTSSKSNYVADVYVNTSDYAYFETQLLDESSTSYSSSYWEKKIIAPSAFMAFLGLNKKINNLRHHNLFLENDWMKHFDEIFENPSWPESPSYYVSCPTKTDHTIAPAGCDSLFILVPVAPGLEDDESIRDEYFQKVINHLEGLLGENITNSIVTKKLYAHEYFANTFNAYKGTALGLTHTMSQTAIFRPANKSKKVKNLFYAGQYTNPGIGVPMCLISAQIVNNLIKKQDV